MDHEAVAAIRFASRSSGVAFSCHNGGSAAEIKQEVDGEAGSPVDLPSAHLQAPYLGAGKSGVGVGERKVRSMQISVILCCQIPQSLLKFSKRGLQMYLSV
jgi:hypothetical protein